MRNKVAGLFATAATLVSVVAFGAPPAAANPARATVDWPCLTTSNVCVYEHANGGGRRINHHACGTFPLPDAYRNAVSSVFTAQGARVTLIDVDANQRWYFGGPGGGNVPAWMNDRADAIEIFC
ncbi:hypothetical protein [Embleya hyalina]|uniref:Peptidase inhibitor family I36 n=1 Tax=Embleya hyalina TaxID=516124 RepID=A0A401YR31_9ACTN|nr:hypothetical protein [Embleya hyalina]GCD97059.1 hypothetical protein EHYA_04746 [Embleya hyalina]